MRIAAPPMTDPHRNATAAGDDPSDRPMRPVDVVIYAILVVIWGGSFYAIEFQLGTVPIEQSIFYRYAVAALTLVLVCVAARRPLLRFSRSDHGLFVLYGVLFFSLNYILIYRAQEDLTSGLTAITFTMALFFATVNARIFLGTPINRSILIGGGIGVGGLVLIFGNSIFAAQLDGSTLVGATFILAAAYVVSLATVVTAKLSVRRIPGLQANTWGMLYGTLINGLFVIFFGNELVFDWSAPYVVAFLYLTFLAGVVAFILYYVIVRRIGPARAAYFTLLAPMVAIVISVFAEGLPITVLFVAGVAAVVAGNYIAVRTRRST